MKRTRTAAIGAAIGIAAVALCANVTFAQTPTSTSLSGAVGIGLSGSNSNSNANASLNNQNTNANTNISGSLATSGSQSKSNANSNQATNYYESTPADQTIKNVPSVYAPGLTAAGSEVCLGSASAGGAAAGFGLTIGGTYVDKECQLRMNARTLAILGYPVAAREELCNDPEVRSALAAAGTPCVADAGAAPGAYRAQVTASTAPVPGPSAPAGCYRTFDLLGGWHDVCK